jgi:predicted transcriptional regulator
MVAMRTDSIDMLALLAQRASLVEQIADGGASKRTLTLTLPFSQSTITRVIHDLAIAKLIQKDNNDYKLTLHGRVAFRSFRHVVDRYSGLTAAAPLLSHLPKTAVIPGVVFDDATIIRPAPPAPDAPRTRFLDHIRQGEEVVGIGNVTTRRSVEVFYEQLTEHDLQLSLLLNEQVVEQLRYAHHDTLSTALQMDHCTLQSLEQTPPFSLTIIDWTVLWLGIYNECGQLQGMLRTTSFAAVEWAEQRLQEYADQATPIRLRGTITGTEERQSS